jgi:hypothetical protein
MSIFGFQGGESACTVARKGGYMQDAQQRERSRHHWNYQQLGTLRMLPG